MAAGDVEFDPSRAEQAGMRPVKQRPRFHCDFCSHTSTLVAMVAHERICWLNPNRHCPSCDDTGFIREDYGGGYMDEPCYWCSKVHPDSKAVSVHPYLAKVATA